MADMPLIFFLLLSVFFSLLFVRKFFLKASNGILMLYGMLTGLSLGFAVSCKMNGGIGLVAFTFSLAALIFVQWIKKKHPFHQFKSIALSWVIALTGMVLVFILFNPFTWSNPLKNPVYMVKHRLKQQEKQRKLFPEDTLYTVGERFDAVMSEVFLPDGNWNTIPGKKLPLDLVLFVLGMILLISDIAGPELSPKENNPLLMFTGFLRSRTPGSNNVQSYQDLFFIIWVFTIITAVIIYLPFNHPHRWARYYLPLIPLIVLVQALTLYWIVGVSFKLLGKVKKLAKR